MFHGFFDAPVVILRPFMTYGAGQAVTKLSPLGNLGFASG
jgi:hypothetical protein